MYYITMPKQKETSEVVETHELDVNVCGKKRAGKVDNSPKVYQRTKIDYELKMRELPWTPRQREFFNLINDKDTRVVFVSGPAGSSKTLTAVRAALDLLNQKKVSDIVCVRAAVESADSKLGFLPGDLGSKYDVYMMPFYDKFEELLTVDQIKRLKGDNRIINQPINFCRGLSFTARIILVDEMQNGTMNEIVTLLTRIGKFSKMIICADPSQSDLPFNKQGGFEKLIKIFDNNAAKEHGIHFFEYGEEDIVRSDLCRFIVEEITKYKKSEEALKVNTITSKSENKFSNGSANVIANAGSGTGAYTGAGIIVNHTGIVNNDCYHKEQSYSETWTPSRDE